MTGVLRIHLIPICQIRHLLGIQLSPYKYKQNYILSGNGILALAWVIYFKTTLKRWLHGNINLLIFSEVPHTHTRVANVVTVHDDLLTH